MTEERYVSNDAAADRSQYLPNDCLNIEILDRTTLLLRPSSLLAHALESNSTQTQAKNTGYE